MNFAREHFLLLSVCIRLADALRSYRRSSKRGWDTKPT